MGSKNDKIISLTAKKFNKLRAKLLPTNTTGFLLVKDSFGTYNSNLTLFNWWYFYDKFREITTCQVATQDQGFQNALLVATHFAILGKIYEMDKRDLAPPDGNRPFWQIYGKYTLEAYP